LIIGASVVVVAIAVIIGIVVAMQSPAKDNAGGKGGATTSAQPPASGTATTNSTTGASSIIQGDQSRTIDQDKCINAHNDLINPNNRAIVTMPDFTSIYVDSVVACIKAANWPYTIKYVNEQQWGKGTVTTQAPKYLDSYNPKTGGKVTIWVSTGKGAN
jgi:hypothetical protein